MILSLFFGLVLDSSYHLKDLGAGTIDFLFC